MRTPIQSHQKIVFIILTGLVTVGLASRLVLASGSAEKDSAKAPRVVEKLKVVLNGFTVGGDTRLFPYASLQDWFEPYGGLKLGHRSPVNPADRMLHHFKFEGIRDYSWKFRYLANSLSSDKTKFSFLFKRKTDRDPYFYGVGNSSIKSQRIPAKYASIFFGAEVKRTLSPNLVFRWSPGFWKFRSGLRDGGEFEEASSAGYMSSRFSLSDRKSVDYWKASLDNQWSAFVEVAFPVNSPVASYIRLNTQTRSQVPTFKRIMLSLSTRFEYLVASDKSKVPYFAIPEAGSRSGLRGFSKERFRNFALAVYGLELALPLSGYFDLFLLSDFAQTAANPTGLVGNHLHASYGFGLRLKDTKHPLSVGIANSGESLKLFSSIAVGSPW